MAGFHALDGVGRLRDDSLLGPAGTAILPWIDTHRGDTRLKTGRKTSISSMRDQVLY